MNADRRQGAPFVIEAPATPGAYPAVRLRRNPVPDFFSGYGVDEIPFPPGMRRSRRR